MRALHALLDVPTSSAPDDSRRLGPFFYVIDSKSFTSAPDGSSAAFFKIHKKRLCSEGKGFTTNVVRDEM
jgi:hypothetical protein